MKLKLLEPIEGFEDVVEYKQLEDYDKYLYCSEVLTHDDSTDDLHTFGHVLTPLKKYVDWSKCSDKLLIRRICGRLSRIGGIDVDPLCDSWMVDSEWQAHTIGDKCPVDSEAFRVDARYGHGLRSANIIRCIASEVDWGSTAQFRVIGLAPGYEYP